MNFVTRILHLILIVLIVLLSSCGAFRKVLKTKDTYRTSVQVSTKKDSVGVHVDKSVITKVDRIDTMVNVPERVVKQDKAANLDSLVHGIMAIQNELVDVRLVLNPTTGIMSATAVLKAHGVDVTLERTMTEQRDITESSDVKASGNSSIATRETHSKVDKESIHIPWYVWLIGIAVACGGLWYWKGRK